MSSPPNKIACLRPSQTCISIAESILLSLKSLLYDAKHEYIETAMDFDSCSVRLGQYDPELRSHNLLGQIEHLEVAIAKLAHAVRTVRSPT